MPKYNVYGIFTGSKFLGEFEADTLEQAIEMASEEAYVSLCHQCSNKIDIGDIDKMEAELLP